MTSSGGNVAIFRARKSPPEIYQAVAAVLDAFMFENRYKLQQRIREHLPDGRVGPDLQAALELVSQLVTTFPSTTQTPTA